MKIQKDNIRAIGLFPRAFTHDQLSKIIEENFEVLSENVNILQYDHDDIFVLYPETHFFFLLEDEVTPLLRMAVGSVNEEGALGLQDLTYEQWVQGEEIE